MYPWHSVVSFRHIEMACEAFARGPLTSQCAGCAAETRTLAGARLHSLVREISSCSEAVDISSPELSVDVLSCLEAPLRGLVGLAADRSDARALARMEDGSDAAAHPAVPMDDHAVAPIRPDTSSSGARRLLQQTACAADEIQYQTACGINTACNSGDRQIGASCTGCVFPCSTWPTAVGTSEICCRKPTPDPTAAPHKNPTSAPISAPPSAPPATKMSNCGLPPAASAGTYTTVRAVIVELYARKRNGRYRAALAQSAAGRRRNACGVGSSAQGR
jgi:hypothetical protein